ncbi:uncharacterized protein LOC111785518 [Cucurbita pepo subsp. pepo]|uniref:uncharacterized protein LOC111785518 n=1 Tax=Cucurbita pepo subsp. pepo TaxID=3664 RepID=UPI000C9D3BDE|nr:uncharacterized protein LOC111785518 [Cucurbita pepo subsp. pepo]
MASSSHPLEEEEEEEIDSDDEFYKDGYRTLTKKEEMEYFRAVKESEGFDVPDFGNVYAFGLILEIPLHDKGFSRILEEVWISTNEAIKYYNNENGTNFEVVDIVKVNHAGTCGTRFYITFNVTSHLM